MKTRWTLALLLCAAPAAATADEKPKAPATQPGTAPTKAVETGVIHRGAAFTLADLLTLDAVAQDAAKYDGKTVKVSGTIKNVCQKKGCWMVLNGATPTAAARVTFKDYAFFVPFDVQGRPATIEGLVQVTKVDEAERKHLADDAKRPLAEIPENELRIVATAVEIAPAP